jgi:hypothetical protein
VEQALEDPDWIVAMEEELNNFKRNEVWELVPRSKQNVIDTKWVLGTRKMNLVSSQRTRQGSLAKATLKLKAWTLERPMHQ